MPTFAISHLIFDSIKQRIDSNLRHQVTKWTWKLLLTFIE